MKFELKNWDEKYIKDVAKHANNEKIASKLRDVFPYPYTYEDAEWYVKDCILNEGNNNITRAIVINGEAVGSIGVFVMDDVYKKSAEIGYWLGEDYWGRGIMSEAVNIIIKEAFDRFDIVRIHAEIFSNNPGSKGVLEKAGFKFEGRKEKSIYKNGEILDSLVYAYIK
ncbi:GNAT family N-acetyltransferase [Anaerofustis stercorihominis]|uniref:N-acetyltransferase n=1 Tax=Anaerofustis stercorihominis TaxID=214853 RepID=A0A3E3DZ12_9FIRM|nr:GNAT family protein [Anaerofustis stercorihominis]MCQ4794274.1 GNAT family N-acetyltransferase [Anaerofustis stercorihominis]RGD74512.1 N-acetyltransferase [Anaerofustis stercorihominis]